MGNNDNLVDIYGILHARTHVAERELECYT